MCIPFIESGEEWERNRTGEEKIPFQPKRSMFSSLRRGILEGKRKIEIRMLGR
jgi:hypothetical protein